MPDDEAVAVAFDAGIGHEVVQVCVVRKRAGSHCRGVVIHQPSEETKRLGFRQTTQSAIGELNFDGACFMVQGADGAIQLALEQRARTADRQPVTDAFGGGTPNTIERCAGASICRRFKQKDEEVVDSVQFVPVGVQVVRSPLKGLVRNGAFAGRSGERLHDLLDDVLVDA
ncbi:MAG: hypothetical protein LC799_32540, partial [Actinobacteria bacterium]|nr:hypothetical protein [Actinomycetota bacterium]